MACLREGDEDGFIDYAENVVITLQRHAHSKPGLEMTAVIETCMKLEELAFTEALKDCSLTGTSSIWNHTDALDSYQRICEDMISKLQELEYKGWIPKISENPPINLFLTLTGRTRASGPGIGFGRPPGNASNADVDDPSFNSNYTRKTKKRKSIPSAKGSA